MNKVQYSVLSVEEHTVYANAQKKSQNEKQKRDNTFESTMVCEI